MTKTRTSTSCHRWTSDDELALIRLHSKGKTVGEIAQELGMRKPQVQHRIVALRAEGRIVGRKLPKEEVPPGTPVRWSQGTYYLSPGRLIHKSCVAEEAQEDGQDWARPWQDLGCSTEQPTDQSQSASNSARHTSPTGVAGSRKPARKDCNCCCGKERQGREVRRKIPCKP